MLANIKLNPGIQLDPQLALVVEKLALKHPTWVFRSHAVEADPATGKHAMGVWYKPIDGEYIAENVAYTRDITVVQDNLVAGKISVDRSYSRRSNQGWHYVLNSMRIDNGRKGHQLTTRDEAVAIRTASRTFLAPSLTEMASTAVDHASAALQATFRDLERPIERGQYCPSILYMQLALYKLLKGIPFDERELRDKLLSDKYEEALANYELAQQMRLAKMKGVIAFRGQYAYLSDTANINEAAVATARPFEELPQSWQEKIAVLQLMRDNELVLDVGYRQNESTFMIVT